MHHSFKLVATQNEADNLFVNKRSRLSTKLISKFTRISYDDIPQEDLLLITKGLNKNISDEDAEKLINFHFAWKDKITKMESSINIYTIRNIKSTIKSLSKDISLFNSILLNYGSSYTENELKEMVETMNDCGHQ